MPLSAFAVAVTVRVAGMAGNALSQKLYNVAGVQRCVILQENPKAVTVRVFPKIAPVNGEFARAVAGALSGAQVEELHSEEGRLDEVFRNITLPDTAKEVAK